MLANKRYNVNQRLNQQKYNQHIFVQGTFAKYNIFKNKRRKIFSIKI